MPLHLDILDVGQGDGMVIWLPNGKVMMVDLGSTKNKGLITEGPPPPLIKRLDSSVSAGTQIALRYVRRL
jgi:hypothetical protein